MLTSRISLLIIDCHLSGAWNDEKSTKNDEGELEEQKIVREYGSEKKNEEFHGIHRMEIEDSKQQLAKIG